jgi:hypothetical protein
MGKPALLSASIAPSACTPHVVERLTFSAEPAITNDADFRRNGGKLAVRRW